MPTFLLVLMFLVTIRVPMTLYLYWAHPAWSWHYFFDPANLPAIAVAFVVILHSGVLIALWYLGAVLLQADRRRTLLALFGLLGLGLIIAAVVLSGRLGAYGSYEAYRLGATLGVMKVKLGYVLIAMVLGVAAAAGFVAVELSRDARRAQSF